MLALLPAAPTAAEPPRLSLSIAAERALAHYPAVAAAKADSEEAQAAAGEAGAARFPTVKAVAAATQYQKDMVATPIHGFGEGQTPPFDDLLLQGGLNISYSLFDGGGRRARILRAESQADAARAGLDALRQAVVNRVVSTYVEVLGRRETLAAHDSRIVSLESERARVRQLLEVGRAAEVDVLRVEAALASGQADRTRVAVTLDRAERNLAALVGAPVDETRAGQLVSLVLMPAPPPLREPLVRGALQASPIVEEARRRQAAANEAVGLAKSARWPEARLVGNYLSFGGGSTPFETEWNAGIQISLPIFDGGAAGKAITKADAARRAASERLRQAELDVTAEVDGALAALQDTQARTTSLTAAVARLEEVVRIQKLLLETGQGTQADYLDAEADLLAARASLSQARLGEVEARAGLARAAGQLTPAWIDENVEKRS
jgi:outer membrane protein TolC